MGFSNLLKLFKRNSEPKLAVPVITFTPLIGAPGDGIARETKKFKLAFLDAAAAVKPFQSYTKAQLFTEVDPKHRKIEDLSSREKWPMTLYSRVDQIFDVAKSDVVTPIVYENRFLFEKTTTEVGPFPSTHSLYAPMSAQDLVEKIEDFRVKVEAYRAEQEAKHRESPEVTTPARDL